MYRYNMLKIATKQYEELEVSDMELNLNENLDAIDVFEMIKEKYADTEIYYIIGADNLYKMPQWKDFGKLVTYKYIVIKRDKLDCNNLLNSNEILRMHKNNFKIIENTKYNMDSATKVRSLLKKSDLKNIEKYIDNDVIEYIRKNNLYK